MKRLSTGVLAALFVTLCGLSAVAAPANATQGNIGNSVAQGGAPPADFGSSAVRPDSDSLQRSPRLQQTRRAQTGARFGGAREGRHALHSAALDVRTDGRNGFLGSGKQNRNGIQARRRGQSDRRQARSHDQRRVASARRSPDDLSGRRRRAGSRDFGRHGRVRAVGSGQAFGRRAVYSRDAAAEPGSAAARRSAAAAAPPPPTPKPFRAKRSSPATTSSRRRSTTSSVPATPAAARLRSAAEVSSASAAFRSWSKARTSAGSIRTTVRRSAAGSVRGRMLRHAYRRQRQHAGRDHDDDLYDQDVDARFAVRVLQPRIYVGVGYIWMANNYGYPNMNGVGFGGREAARSQPHVLVLRERLVLPEREGNASVSVAEPIPATGFQPDLAAARSTTS